MVPNSIHNRDHAQRNPQDSNRNSQATNQQVGSPPTRDLRYDAAVKKRTKEDQKTRLDQAVVAAGLAESRTRAQALILAGKVLIDGAPAHKAGQQVPPSANLTLKEPDHGFVSRGGVKLAGALDTFNWDPTGRTVLDVGASTGGFTDCLLQRGAAAVIALDVGYGQLAWSLRQDPRVTVLERTNIRHVDPTQLQPPPDSAVVDVSFISLKLIIPKLIALLPPAAPIIALIKPQFEAGKAEVGKGGVIRDPNLRQRTIDSVVSFCSDAGCTIINTATSTLPGPKGNVEELLWLKTPAT